MSEPEKDAPEKRAQDDKAYQRAARLLAQKLGVDWRTLDPEAVREYMRKIEIARGKK
jgi:hypothetical protein